MWDPEADTISIQQPLVLREVSVTKREVLSAIASTFDPLGLVAPFTLLAKLLMQELWKQQLTWDAPLLEDDLERWRMWQRNVAKLADLQIPRCYRSTVNTDVTRRELYVFCDAPEAVFGAVVYLRQTLRDGTVRCTLVASRNRVAPLKKLTIVHLELQSAVSPTRLAQNVSSSLSNAGDGIHFWTDSEVVLGYINNDCRRFQTFVANRVAEIRDTTTTPSQWRHVPTSQHLESGG